MLLMRPAKLWKSILKKQLTNLIYQSFNEKETGVDSVSFFVFPVILQMTIPSALFSVFLI